MIDKSGKFFLKSTPLCDRKSLLYTPLEGSDEFIGKPDPLKESDSYSEDDLIFLTKPNEVPLIKRDVFDIFNDRESRRKMNGKKITFDELSFLLWATQGERIAQNGEKKRTVPSAGARYPIDTYFFASNVDGVPVGLYRYIHTVHAILQISIDDESREHELIHLWDGSRWKGSVLTIFWVAVPYRCVWRYKSYAYKFCGIDVGHIGQNGYLATEALGLACCTIGRYPQKLMDKLLGVNGEEKFTCYIGVFGRYC
jgi:SagB-type dehydrogenase family enzyme